MHSEEEFRQALRDKKVPLLVLDQKWHRLFAVHGKTEEIKEREAEINRLLARQGKLNSELKELKKLKNKLMGGIVQNMDDSGDTVREKKLDESKRLIDETNEKMAACEEELLDIPVQIKENNGSLMLLSMDYFYEKLRVNAQESKEIEEWINQVRVDLKKNIIRKQNRDINNREIYAYLHDILGAEVLDIFDLKYESQNEEEEESGEEQTES
ncbi:MAG: hypothetical protein NC180_11250 [Muribaculaceae bacterium]|nr:hypothetical protein [Roseburia sp.]MCM1430981.1 hypothetical protein [Muribaculaceae bacterium]MCM1493785.1 hypothetical protein [Muribaculaceae bacterium]